MILADLGGGTIDYVTYHPLKNVSGTFDLRECIGGQGAKSGSAFIDQIFHDWTEAKFGASFLALSPNKFGPNSHFMRQFEGFKQSFGEKKLPANYEYFMLLPMANCPKSANYNPDDFEVKLIA